MASEMRRMNIRTGKEGSGGWCMSMRFGRMMFVLVGEKKVLRFTNIMESTLVAFADFL